MGAHSTIQVLITGPIVPVGKEVGLIMRMEGGDYLARMQGPIWEQTASYPSKNVALVTLVPDSLKTTDI